MYLVREMNIKLGEAKDCPDIAFDCVDKVFNFFKDWIGNEAQENLVILAVDTRLRATGWNLVSRGTVNETTASAREIFKFLLLANAAGFFLCHNHPSGILTPSNADIKLTQMIIMLGQQHGIPLYDHLIISQKERYSLKEHGII